MAGLRVVERRRVGVGRLAEFVALYFGVPLVMALLLPPDALWPTLAVMTVLAAVLLGRTAGFRWGELAEGAGAIDWRMVGGVAAATAVAGGGLVWVLVPDEALALPRRSTGLWLMILVGYPFLSALPQELIFRALFFRRYGALFPNRRIALGVNGALFAFAHLMFWNWVAILLCLAGGIVFSRAYLSRGGFPEAVLLHALCGGMIFTAGLGRFFYAGAVGP